MNRLIYIATKGTRDMCKTICNIVRASKKSHTNRTIVFMYKCRFELACLISVRNIRSSSCTVAPRKRAHQFSLLWSSFCCYCSFLHTFTCFDPGQSVNSCGSEKVVWLRSLARLAACVVRCRLEYHKIVGQMLVDVEDCCHVAASVTVVRR